MSADVSAYPTAQSLRDALAEILLAIDEALNTGEVHKNMDSVRNHVQRAIQNQITGHLADILDADEFGHIWPFIIDWREVQNQPEAAIKTFLETQRADLRAQGLWSPLKHDSSQPPVAESVNPVAVAEAPGTGKRGRAAEDEGEDERERPRSGAGAKRSRAEEGQGGPGEVSATLTPTVPPAKAAEPATALGPARGPPTLHPTPAPRPKRRRSPSPPIAGPSNTTGAGRAFLDMEGDSESVAQPSEAEESAEEHVQGKGKGRAGPSAEEELGTIVVNEKKGKAPATKKTRAKDAAPRVRKPPILSGYEFDSPCQRCVSHKIPCKVCWTIKGPRTDGACFSCSKVKMGCKRPSNDATLVGTGTETAPAEEMDAEGDESDPRPPPPKKAKRSANRVVSRPIVYDEDEEEEGEEAGAGADADVPAKQAPVVAPTTSARAKPTGRVLNPTAIAKKLRERIAAEQQPALPASAEGPEAPAPEVEVGHSAIAPPVNADQPADHQLPANLPPLLEFSQESLQDIAVIVEETCATLLQQFVEAHKVSTSDFEAALNRQMKTMRDEVRMSIDELRYQVTNDNRLDEAIHHIRRFGSQRKADIGVQMETPSAGPSTPTKTAEMGVQTESCAEADMGMQTESRPEADMGMQTESRAEADMGVQTESCAEADVPETRTEADEPTNLAILTEMAPPELKLIPPTLQLSQEAASAATTTADAGTAAEDTQAPAIAPAAMADAGAVAEGTQAHGPPAGVPIEGEGRPDPPTSADSPGQTGQMCAPNVPAVAPAANVPGVRPTADVPPADNTGGGPPADLLAGSTLLPPRRSPRIHSRSPSPRPT